MILENQIDIDAPQDRVWKITIDVESWPQWSPAMERIVREDKGEFQVGSTALIKQKMIPETRWVVTSCTPPESFSWKAKVLGIEMIATHFLLPRESGVTSMLQLEMVGAMAAILGPAIKDQVTKALAEENHGLKQFCEAEEKG